jgi:hypothetical protein
MERFTTTHGGVVHGSHHNQRKEKFETDAKAKTVLAFDRLQVQNLQRTLKIS